MQESFIIQLLKGTFKRTLPDVLIKLERAGYETSAYATEREGDATLEAERALKRDYDIIIAVVEMAHLMKLLMA